MKGEQGNRTLSVGNVSIIHQANGMYCISVFDADGVLVQDLMITREEWRHISHLMDVHDALDAHDRYVESASHGEQYETKTPAASV